MNKLLMIILTVCIALLHGIGISLMSSASRDPETASIGFSGDRTAARWSRSD